MLPFEKTILNEPLDIDQLYERYSPKILDYIRRHGGSHEDAEDIIVDIFMSAFQNAQFTILGEQQQRAWLWRAARNKLIDLYRRSQRYPKTSLHEIEDDVFEYDELNPELTSLRTEADTYLRELIRTLSPLQQEVLHLRFSGELTSPQIAQRIGKREGSVRSILSRTLNHLRSLYEK